MRFLVGTNPPPGLAVWLVSEGDEACHVRDVGLHQAKHRLIWHYAKDNAYCIVTKDEDFVFLSAADQTGPRGVWVRIGNAVRRVLTQRMAGAWPQILAKLKQGEMVVEVR